jgi:hypothetical protein
MAIGERILHVRRVWFVDMGTFHYIQKFVIPANNHKGCAGPVIQSIQVLKNTVDWVPAFAGTTEVFEGALCKVYILRGFPIKMPPSYPPMLEFDGVMLG